MFAPQSAGIIGVASMLALWLQTERTVAPALLLLTAGSVGVAISDVAIDACVAESSISHPSLAADMQSLCELSSAIGGLLGFGMGGTLLRAFSPQEVLGLLSIPYALVFSVGLMINELPSCAYERPQLSVSQTSDTVWDTLQRPEVWRSCLFMYATFALSLNIEEGMFFWYTDSKFGPSFSKETISFIGFVGSIGSLLGVLLYQKCLKDYNFRTLIFWTQLLFAISGMLDIVLVSRANSKIGTTDRTFVLIAECVSQMIARIRWMPFLVLSSMVCPSGIEATFFALLMAVDHIGKNTSSWAGSMLLGLFRVTRTDFDNLWAVVAIRNMLRLVPLAMLNWVPKSDQHSYILPTDVIIKTNMAESNMQSSLIHK